MKNRIDTVKQQPPTVPLAAQNTIAANHELRTKSILGWAVLPLRLFIGITFIYAGIQKLTDPQYFHPSAARYIGNQIAAFASGSPMHGFLVNVAGPHAMLVGALVAYGELAIGLGALFGLLLRPAAFCGILLNLVFFLSATWRVYPYFYGSDIVFIFCWITLLIAGPSSSILPSLETRPTIHRDTCPPGRVPTTHLRPQIIPRTSRSLQMCAGITGRRQHLKNRAGAASCGESSAVAQACWDWCG